MLVTERTTFSAELQKVMAAKGATEWAKVLDVDRTTVHKWWSGDAFPRGRQLEAIARETGHRLQFVAHEEEAPEPDWVQGLESRLVAAIRAGATAAAAEDVGARDAEFERRYRELLEASLQRPSGQAPDRE